jgi:uncharacterized OsmC-like protein
MKCYQIKAIGEKNAISAYTDTNHRIETDLPKIMGGSDKAPQPVEYLLAALIGCTQATAVFVGRNMKPRRLNISEIKFDIQAYRDERGALGGSLPIEKDSALPAVPSRIQLIIGKIEVILKNNQRISEEEMILLEKQTEARCPVANMMRNSGCAFDIKWIDGNDNQPISV